MKIFLDGIRLPEKSVNMETNSQPHMITTVPPVLSPKARNEIIFVQTPIEEKQKAMDMRGEMDLASF